MTEDVKGVQTDAVSKGTESKTTEETKVEPVQPQPLTEEILNKKIQEALATATEQAKREIQSIKDKSKAEIEKAQREANLHKETLSTFEGNLGEIDPEMSRNLELAKYKAKDRATAIESQREQVNKQQQETFDGFNSNMNQFITDSGLDPNDKRIDWGNDAQTLLEKQQKILASVAKIHKAIAKDAKEELSKTVKDEIAKARKEMGLDSVDTSHPVGAAKDISKFTADDWIEKGLKDAKKK